MPAPLPNSAAMDALVEELLTKDVYIVDYLPRTCLLYTSPSPRDA